MRTGIIVAAHNEAGVIVDTISRLIRCADAVYVIADNCADATAHLAAEAGARVYERHDLARGGKGAALAWFAQAAASELASLDLLIIFDAECRIADGFVPAIADCFARGALAAQSFTCPMGAEQSSASALAAYSELLSQRIGDKIRARLGWAVQLRGRGMAFHPSLFCEMVSCLRTRTEDIEMSLWLASHGIRIHSVPHAVVYDAEPVDARRVSRQRARWLQGQMEVWRYHWRGILRLVLTGGPAAWSLLWSVLVKPKTLVFAGKLVLLPLLSFFALSSLGPAWLRVLPVTLAGFSLAMDLIYYLVGLFLVEDRSLYARALLAAPLYLAVWLRSLVLMGASEESWLRARD